MEFGLDLPIYMQIIQDIKQKIASGEWPPGMRVPPVRELSLTLGVNPNTAQRALAELERDGLLYTQRTAGRFITDNTQLVRQVKSEMAEACIGTFLKRMASIGFSREEAVRLISLMNNQGEDGVR